MIGASLNRSVVVRFPGVQFGLCECSKYLFYLQYESGSLYRPSSRDFELQLAQPTESDLKRLSAIWVFWERDESDNEEVIEDGLHPDHTLP